jgi:hypothetical protein
VPARARPWLRAATLAAAAAIGALVGFGISDGASLARLGAVTLRLRGLPEFVSPDRGAVGAALLGGAHVALVSGIWGACAGALNARLVGRLRPAGSAAVLAGFGVLLALADRRAPRDAAPRGGRPEPGRARRGGADRVDGSLVRVALRRRHGRESRLRERRVRAGPRPKCDRAHDSVVY